MSVKSVLENHPLVLVVGVAVASGVVVAGVMFHFNETALSTRQAEIEDLQFKLNRQIERTEELAQTVEGLALAERFKSLHARVLTFAAVNPECRPFDRGFGNMLAGADWNPTELADEYRAALEALEEADLARVQVQRAGPQILAFDDGGSWPIADPRRCAEN